MQFSSIQNFLILQRGESSNTVNRPEIIKSNVRVFDIEEKFTFEQSLGNQLSDQTMGWFIPNTIARFKAQNFLIIAVFVFILKNMCLILQLDKNVTFNKSRC